MLIGSRNEITTRVSSFGLLSKTRTYSVAFFVGRGGARKGPNSTILCGEFIFLFLSLAELYVADKLSLREAGLNLLLFGVDLPDAIFLSDVLVLRKFAESTLLEFRTGWSVNALRLMILKDGS